MKNKVIILITVFTLIFANIYISFGDQTLPKGQEDKGTIQEDSQESQSVNINNSIYPNLRQYIYFSSCGKTPRRKHPNIIR